MTQALAFELPERNEASVPPEARGQFERRERAHAPTAGATSLAV